MFFKRSKKAEDKSTTTLAGTASSSTLNTTPSSNLTPAGPSSTYPASNFANNSTIVTVGQARPINVQTRPEALSNNVSPNRLGQQSPNQSSNNRRRSSANRNPNHQSQQPLLQPVDIAMSLAVNQQFNQFNNHPVMHTATHPISQPMGYHNGHIDNHLGYQTQHCPVGYGLSYQANSINSPTASSVLHIQSNSQGGSSSFVNNSAGPVSNSFHSHAYTHNNHMGNPMGHLANEYIRQNIDHRQEISTGNLTNQQNHQPTRRSDDRLTTRTAAQASKHPSPRPEPPSTGSPTVGNAPSSNSTVTRFNPAASSFNPVPTSSIPDPLPRPTASQPALPRTDSLDIQKTKRTPTDSSYYSCSGLQSNDPLRYIKAADVRRQVQQAPSEKPPMSSYPKLYQNVENLKLQAPEEHFEWPIMSQGNWNPTRAPNKVRAMFNKTDRSAFDVAYHDKTMSQENRKNFRLANYRASVAAEKDTTQKKF